MRFAKSLSMLGLLIAITGSAGCLIERRVLVGDGRVHRGRFFGDLGVSGNRSSVTLLPGSKIWKLTILGDQNHVRVDDGAIVNRIEFRGCRNEVFVPSATGLVIQSWGDPSNYVFVRDAGRALEPPPSSQPAPPKED